jgi:FlaA1/EpsC-like NDP-sugar epimerase
VFARLKALDWSRFLARPCVMPPSPVALDALRNASVLVAGAGGSIGSALALRLASIGPRALVLLEASESRLYALQRECADAGLAVPTAFLLGSVADRALLEEIFAAHSPRLVFHAAAFKHVPLLEEQPFAAIENNVFGTLSLVAAASRARVILLSTDKAVEPASIMGATKRVAEHIVLAAGGTALRLGNVLASRDSVTEVFARQIAAGGPLTVTGPAARRYFLTLDEAVNLLLSAAAEQDEAALLAPALSAPHLICDLARFMAQELAPDCVIHIDFNGPRPGDKETELFWSTAETATPPATGSLFFVQSPPFAGSQLRGALAELRAALDARDLPAALVRLCALVPDYTPSAGLMALAGPSLSQALS